jgi:hypothetical protein
MNFKTKIEWDKSSKLCKLYTKKSSKGEVYMMGDFNKMFKITIWKRKGYQGAEDFYEAQLIPVKYEKQSEDNAEHPTNTKQAPQTSPEPQPTAPDDKEPDFGDVAF